MTHLPSLLTSTLLAAPLFAAAQPTQSLQDGDWQGKLRCGEHQVTRAGPYSQDVSFSLKSGRFSATVFATWPEGKDRIEWSGEVQSQNVKLNGLGNRIGTPNTWQTRLSGTVDTASSAFTVSGHTYFQGAIIRECKMDLTRAKADSAARGREVLSSAAEKPNGSKQD